MQVSDPFAQPFNHIHFCYFVTLLHACVCLKIVVIIIIGISFFGYYTSGGKGGSFVVAVL